MPSLIIEAALEFVAEVSLWMPLGMRNSFSTLVPKKIYEQVLAAHHRGKRYKITSE
ncbi:MAG: hypothetical protein ACI9G5_001650 [Paracoccaceae bacterium]|jgi:hypothetical protein